MNEIRIDNVIAQMRTVAAQSGLNAMGEQSNAQHAGFSSLLKDTLEQINRRQHKASDLAQSLERGEAGVDISNVMVEMQKARIAFEAAVQVRNRLISAYQDIMNMPV